MDLVRASSSLLVACSVALGLCPQQPGTASTMSSLLPTRSQTASMFVCLFAVLHSPERPALGGRAGDEAGGALRQLRLQLGSAGAGHTSAHVQI